MVKNLSTIDRSTKVRLGRHATDDQADNTIVINASNAPISAQTPGSLYMTPVRKVPGGNTKIVGYDNITNEIVDTDIDEQAIIPRVVDFYANIGNTFTSTIVFEGENSLITTGNVGISNTEPIHTLDVGSNLWVDDTGSTVLNVTGGVHIDGNLDVEGQLTVIESQNLRISDAIIEVGKGNTTADVGMMFDHQGSNVVVGYKDDELIMAHTQSSADQTSFTANTANPIKAHVYGYLVTQSNVGVINTNPIHTLDVGSNLYVDDVASNVLYVKGATDLDGNLIVYENAYIEQDLRIKENAYVTQDLTVTENVLVSNNLTVTKDLTVNDNAYVTQDLTVTENVLVSNNLTVTKDLEVTENVLVSNNLTVTKDVEVVENVLVSNNLTVTKDLTVNDNVYVTQDLTVTENVLVSNNLTVTKDLTVNNDAYVTQDLTVTENVLVSNNLTVTKDVEVVENVLVSNNLTVTKDVEVVENVLVSNNLTVTKDLTVNDNAYVTQDLTVTENVLVSNNLTVTKNSYVTKDLTVTENVFVSNNLTVTKDTTTQDIKVTTLSAGRVPFVDDNKYLVDSANFIYDTSNNKLTVTGDIVTTGNMFIQGETTYVSTENLVVNDAIIGIANNNTSDTLDMGIIMQRPSSNVVIGYRGDESEIIMAHTLDGFSNIEITPDTSNLIDVHVYGRLKTDTNVDVGSNIYITDTGSAGLINVIGNVTATTFNGDGGLLSNIDLQVVSDKGNSTTQTVQFTNPTTAFTTDLTSNVQLKLDQLSNVNLESLSEDQLLVYDGANWVNDYNVHNFVKIKNNTGADLLKGQAVYVKDGWNANVSNVALAQSDSSSTMPSIGVIHDTVANGGEGVAVAYGKVQNIDTSNFEVGQTVYVSNTVPGGLMGTKPYGLTDQIQNVGICLIKSTQQKPNKGTIFVTGVGRSNDIPNAQIVQNETAINYVYVNDTNNDLKKIVPSNLLTQLQTLQQVTDTSNTTSNTIRFTNATTGFETTSNAVIGSNISITGLTQKFIPFVGDGNFLQDSSIKKDNGNIIITADTEITGNLLVNGNTYTISSSELIIDDRIIAIANNNPSHNYDEGIIMFHPGHNVALIHHGDEDRFSMGYTQNTVNATHVLPDDGNTFALDVLGTISTQNSITVRGGGSYFGDGGTLSNVTLERVITLNNTADSTVIFDNKTAAFVTNVYSNTGIANLNPIHMLDVGANVYVEDGAAGGTINVIGNVTATSFIGDGGLLSNLATNFDEIIINGNTTTGTAIFDNTTAALVTNVYSNTGIANLNPIHMLDVGDNIYMDSVSINVTGNVAATRFIGDGGLLSNLATNFDEIIINGNTTTGTAIFDNTTAALVTNVYSNTGIANLNPIHMLDVGANVYIEDGTINVIGNVTATTFIGDGGLLSNLATNFDEIIINGNTTTGTAIFDNTTAALVTNVYSNTGIANLNPIHMLDVGDNIYMDSTSMNVTGNVVATRFIGDGSFLDNIASTLEQIIINGNTTSNTVIFDNTMASFVTNVYSNTGIANLNPIHTLDIGSNVWFTDTENYKLNINGNAIMKNITLDSITLGTVFPLQAVTRTGNTTSNTVEFKNDTTGLVTTSNAGIANINVVHTLDVGANLYVEDTGSNVLYVRGNTYSEIVTTGALGVNNIAAQHDLSIGSNLWVEDTGSNVLTITGNVLANKLTLGSIELIPSYTLDNVIDVSNVASNTVEFNDATTAFVTASNVGIGTTDPRTLLEVRGGLITNSDSYACKRYSYSNVSIPANFSNVALVFASNVFCAKITAQLLHGNEEVSTMVLNAQGGTRNGSISSLDIATSSMTLFGHTNGYPWSPTMAVTPTKIIMEPSGTGTATFGCDLFVEYTSSAPDGKLESISIGDDTVKSFVY
jgi:UDP-3-O-[3-hydroxymyristoyl] glucosamine N-acyltransferase